MYSVLKRLLVGRPLPSAEQEHQRLIKLIALAVFSSDAISSTAYATEVVIVLLAIVAVSYRQTIYAYPSGGGSYVVSRVREGVVVTSVPYHLRSDKQPLTTRAGGEG